MINFKELNTSEDIKEIIKFFIYAFVLGVPLNFSVWIIFGLDFNWYSWLGWGIGLWFIENRLVAILRRIFLR